MERETTNYGVQGGPGPHDDFPGPRDGLGGSGLGPNMPSREPYGPPGSRGTLSVADERTWSVLAHLSTFLNLFTGFLGPVAAFVVWLAYRDRSSVVAAHALRSVFYQVAWLVVLAVGWTITGLLTTIVVGFLLVPVMILLTLAPFVQASYEAYKAYTVDRHRYL